MKANLFFVLVMFMLFFQRNFSQQLVINEVSQGPTGAKEYVELLVVGTPTCNAIPCLDIRNYIIDDNNGNHAIGAGTGIAAGCVRLKNIAFWSCIPIGTMILIYNDADLNALIPAQDLSMIDGNCKLVIPISDCTLLEHHTTQPNTGTSLYPVSGYVNCGNWTQISMANGDDSFQTIDAAGSLVHSVSWGNNTLLPIIYFAGSAAGKVAFMNNSFNNNPATQANWSFLNVPGNETPGVANNPANAAWISSMNNSCTPLTTFSISTTVSNAGCTCNGSATVTASGAIGPYTYTWLPSGGNSNIATGLCAGIYTVSSTSSNGCLLTTTVNIASAGSLTTTITSSNVSCNGGANGTATVGVTGGTGPYNFTWTPAPGLGQGTGTVSGLSAQTYTILISDALGCTTTQTLTITQPPILTAIISSSNVSCNGGTNGNATVTAGGGTPAYTYSWLPSGGTSSVASGLAAGTYTALVTDTKGCTVTAVVTITQPPILTAIISSSNVSCNGGTNGSATVTAGGGTPAYTYSWLPSGGTSSVASGLAAGTYTALVTDTKGCTVTAVVTITQPPILTAIISSSNVSCNGGTNGSATVTAGGGTPAYTYSWLPSGGTSSVASGLAAGNYTALVTDTKGCTVTAVVTITQPPILTAVISFSNVSCNGGTNGSATVTSGGGTPAYTYSWMPTGGTSSVAAGLGAGTYTALVTDTKGCTVTAVVTITQPPILTAIISSSNVSCNGGTNGTATVTAGGGTPAYIYSWLPSGGTSSVAAGLGAGTFTALVTDTKGCTVTAVVTITQPPILTASVLTTNANCGMLNGSATVTAGGGTPAYSYSWMPSGGTSSVASGLGAGTYSAIVTDIRGCTVTAIAIINQPNSITTTITSLNLNCNGSANGSATLAVAGGVMPYNYTWTPTPGLGQGTGTVAGLSAQTYSVFISDVLGCNTIATITITQPSILTAVISSTNINCNGASNGILKVTAGGGTPVYTYSWIPSGGTSSISAGLGIGNYTAVVTDNNGCTTTAVANITQPPILTAPLTSTNISCFGLNNGAISVNANGGTPGYSYTWTPNGGNASTTNSLSAGNYSVLIKDINNCTVVATTSISQPNSPLSIVMSNTNISCFGNSNGIAAVNANGGVAPYTYSWNPVGTNNSSINNLAAGNYSVLVKDANNCSKSAATTILQPPALTVNINPLKLCKGQSGLLNASAAGGIAPYNYFWNNNTGGISISVSPTTTSVYTLNVVDANGCISPIDTALINVGSSLSLSVTPSKTICAGVTTSLSANATGGLGNNYQYTWMPGNLTGPTITATINVGTVYTVSVSDGCTQPNAIQTTTVYTEVVSASSLVANVYKGCSPLSVTFTNSSILNNPNIQTSFWNFSDGSTSNSFLPTHCFDKPGTFTAYNVFSTKLGCIGSATLTNFIEVYQKPTANFIASQYTVSNYNPLVEFTNHSLNATYYLWDFAGQAQSTLLNPSHNFNNEGRYLVALVAYNETCSDTLYKVIECLPEFTFYAPNTFTPNDDNLNDKFLPKGEGWNTETYNLYVFDRWGEQLFHSKQYNQGWDGKYKNDIVKEDVYVWKVMLKDVFGKQHEYVGTTTVLK